MLKLTKTGIGLLTKQYRSVLRKCWAINEGLFWATIFPMIITSNISFAQSSVAIGSGADASGAYSVAIGNLAKAVGYASFALAPSAKTEARESVAIGNRSFTSAEADKSVALGYNSVANEGFVISVGHTATDINYENGSAYGSNLFRRIVNVAEGSGAHDAVTVSQLGNIAAGTKILNANGESAITFGTESGQTTVGRAISNVANQLYNYYYTKDEIRNSSVWKLFDSANGNYYSASAGTASVISALDAQIKVNSDAITNVYTKSEVQNIQSLNYYYTFRVDESNEMIEFALFLNNEKISNVFDV